MLLPMLSHLTDAKYCFEIGDAALIDNPSTANGLAQRWISILAPKASKPRVQVQSAVFFVKQNSRSTAAKPVQQMISIFIEFDAAAQPCDISSLAILLDVRVRFKINEMLRSLDPVGLERLIPAFKICTL